MRTIIILYFSLLMVVPILSQTSDSKQPIEERQPNDYSIAELDSLLTIFENEQDADKIIRYAQNGADRAAKSFGNQDTSYARMIYFLAVGAFLKQDLGTVQKHLTQAIAIQQKKIPKSINLYNSLNLLVYYYAATEQYTLIEPACKQALAITKEATGEKTAAYASVLNNLANSYYVLGRYTLAEPLYLQAIKINKEIFGDHSTKYANALTNLASTYHIMGSYALAEPMHKEAMKIYKEVLGEKDPDYAMSLMNFANLQSNLHNRPLAEQLLKKAISIYKEALGSDAPDYGLSLINLASLYKENNEYALAEPLYKECINIYKKTFGEKNTNYANSLNDLAVLYKDMGKYALAESLQKQAASIYKETLGDNHPYTVRSLYHLAELYKDLKDYKNSWFYIQQTMAANSGLAISLNINPAWADSLAAADYSFLECMALTLKIVYHLLAVDTLQHATNNSTNPQSSQIIVTDLALRLLQKKRNSFSNEADKLHILGRSSDWVLLSMAVLDKKTQADKAFIFAEQSKSILLLEAAQAQQAYSFGDLPDSLVQQELNLQKKRGEYEAGIAENRPESEKDELRKALNNLNFDIKNFRTRIEKSYPKYADLKYQNNTIEVKKIQESLDDKTAILEYLIGDSIVYIFYIDQQNLRLLEHRVSKTELTQKIQLLHHALSDYNFIVQQEAKAYRDYTQTAYWFYQHLVAPALETAENAKKINRLIIVSDGELGHLPFETFLVKRAPQAVSDYAKQHYLINDYKISYNYSATLWKANTTAKKNKNNGQILAMAANYNIKMDSTKTDWRLPANQRLREGLGTLPEAKKEVETLAATFSGFFGFDQASSEKNFKEKAGTYAVIHLAMHGLLDNKEPILSSLVFTEDGDSLENNFLHAYEISKMNLNADLVVLSACETGYGRFEKGNGIASLAQAFAYAGAPAMIVSLWQVNDYATSTIMKNIYNNLATGMEKDEALRQAKLEYLKLANNLAAHPAFWSPFILMGNTGAITLGRTHVFAPTWIIIGISLAVLAVITFAIKRKKRQNS